MQLIRFFGILNFVLLFVLNGKVNAQSKTILDKTVTLQVSNKSYAEIFKSLSNQTGAIFSYSENFNASQITSINCYKKPLRFTLNELINKGTCYYKVKEKYIIIKCDKKKEIPTNKISGYVLNATDSSSIAGASIYIKQNKNAALSNNYGNFTLSHHANLPAISVSFAKENYKDTTVVLINENKNEITVYLYPINKKPIDTQPQIEQEIIDTLPGNTTASLIQTPKSETILWKKLKKFNNNLSNISDTLFSNFSVSLVPKISTNSLLSFNTVNKYALNLLIGYSKGIDVLEIGGLLNIDNGNVKYVQMAGLGNLVAGEVKGFQAAGLFNVNRKNTIGVQLAGLGNQVNSNVNGLQGAGLYNYCQQMKGIQTAGLINVAKDVKGAQMAGLLNIANTVKGPQIAGLLNTAKTINGIQVAGLMNIAKTVNGVQVAGIFNAAKKINGFQLALVNYADSANGVPLGLFSFVKSGYHKIEIAIDEVQFVTLGFGSGVEQFYNLIFGGANIKNNNLLTLGYGLGGSQKIKGNFRLAWQATAQQMQDVRSQYIYLQMTNKLFIGAEYRLNKKLAFTVGPTYNFNISEVGDPYYSLSYQQIPQKPLNTFANNNFKMTDWLGFKVALKLL